MSGIFSTAKNVNQAPWQAITSMMDRNPQTTSTEPWKPQQPYLTQGMEEAKGESLGAPDAVRQYFEQQLAQRGEGGAPFETAAKDQLTGTLKGDYLYGGSGFNAAMDAAKRAIIPGVESRFAAGGRTGSGSESVAETRALGDAFAGLYGQERQNQMGALGQVPAMQGVDYRNIAAVGDAANQRRQAIMDYMKTIGGSYGGTATQPGASPFLSALGGAATGAQFGPWGAAAGGALGWAGSR